MLTFFWPFASKAQPSLESIVVPGKSSGPTEIINAIISRKSFLEQASLEQLESMQRMLLRAQVDPAHPLAKKIHDAIFSAPGRMWVPPKPGDALDQASVKQGVVISPKTKSEPQSRNVYEQQNIKICDVIDHINVDGIDMEKLVLTSIDNQLMGLIALVCNILKEFVFNLRPDKPDLDFTDEGLQKLAKINALQKLTLNCWDASRITNTGLNQLLGSTYLRKGLTELNVTTFLFADNTFEFVSKYEQLQKFSVSSASLTTAGMETFIGSPSIQATLNSFSAYQGENWGAIISDKFLQGLCLCKGLQTLRLDGKWQASDQSLEAALASLSGLTTLEISGIPLTKKGAELISKLPLKFLSVADCSKLEQADFEQLLKSQALTNLEMGKCRWLKNLSPITNLPNLQHLALGLAENKLLGHGINPICDSETMQKNLRSLCVMGDFSTTSKDLGKVGQLSLETLRFLEVLKFNDESMSLMVSEGHPLVKTLQTLEFNQVSISNNSAGYFNRLRLLNLMLANCNSVTGQGLINLLRSEQMATFVQKLSLYNQTVEKATLGPLSEMNQLTVLMVGNPNIPLEDFFHLHNVKSRNGVIVPYAGIIFPFDQFIRAV